MSVSAQVDPADMKSLAAKGFRSIISNRPDGEEAGQPSWKEVSDAARSAGMQARHIPVLPGSISDSHAEQFREALDELPGPVLGFCRTGMRAASLWALANAGKLPAEDIIRTAAQAGYDLTGMQGRLAGS